MAVSKRILPLGILEKFENNELKVPFTKGEYYLSKQLDAKLPDEWVIHTKPELRNRWGSNICPQTPDVVIANKRHGIMIIEIKDWQIDLPKYKSGEKINRKGKKIWEVFIEDEKGTRTSNINPVYKADGYRLRMIDGIHEIQEEIFNDKRKNILIKSGLYFHNIISSQKAKSFVGIPKYFNPDRCTVFGRDMLDKNVKIEQFIPLINNNIKIHSNTDWLSKFKNWISPPLHISEGQNLISERDLNDKQKRYIISRPGVIQKLSGVAGSGKTRVIAIRAASLAKLGKKILVICYNITLKNYLKKEIEGTKYDFDPTNIDIFYFHDFCKAYREFRNIEYPDEGSMQKNDELEKEKIIRDKIENRNLSANYDAIIIDEGQDFKETWFKLLRNFLSQNGEMLIAFDDKQNIYSIKKFKISGVGSGRWGVLNKGYRLLNEHIKLVNKFSNEFLTDFKSDEENPIIETNTQHTLPFEPNSLSKWINVNNIVESRDMVCEMLNHLDKNQKLDFSDTAILVPDHDEGINLREHILEYFKNKNLKISDIFSKNPDRQRDAKKIFNVFDSDRRLKMSTINSFKGWERRNIIILIPYKTDKNFDFKMYTSMTRVREKLIIINLSERYKNFENIIDE
tara:strand:+ start:422 stop:2296 length:1875 start_codon:yes stop_codon:yes gene_type:complete